MTVPALFLKFRALVMFFDEQAEKLGVSLEDIYKLTPHYATAIKKQIDAAEGEYRLDNAHEVDVKIGLVKKLYFTAVKEIERKKRK